LRQRLASIATLASICRSCGPRSMSIQRMP
jgi:hypothetical protein